MTVESELLTGLVGFVLALLIRPRHGRVESGPQWHDPPRWLQRVARVGSGSLGLTDLSFQAYLFGVLGLALAALITGSDGILNLAFPAWLLGGPILPTLVATGVAIGRRIRQRPGE